MDLIKTPKVDNVRLMTKHGKRKAAVGTLYLTATHLIFVDPDCSKETWILHSHIASVEKLPLNAAGSPLKIRCKTFQIVTFIISRDRDSQEIYSCLLQLSNPEKLEDLYAFSYNPLSEKLTRSAGWALFDIQSEYARMGLPNSEWCCSTLNKDYKICDTYPSILYLPVAASNPVLVGSARFRSRGRLPALSFYYKKTKSAICRCSQPLSGFNSRCQEDETLIDIIMRTTPSASYVYIVDTRPKINAMANKAAGKGYENTDFYENVKFQFVGIENIHVMRQSLQKMTELVCETPDLTVKSLTSGLESSGWLKHIKSVLDTSVFIAKAVAEESVNVVVHCSDGWDRTAQTCSLASIILDPYYRTMHGFQVLIEKEWLAFGHKFTDRCGFLQSDGKDTSPVFLQFLEGVWQLQEQFPFAFQFNERFLLAIHDHLYSCQFGTFLGNCERERKEHGLAEKTYSLWGYMWQNISDYANPLYRGGADELLWPSTSPQVLKFWRSMYNRYDNDLHPRETVLDSLSSIIDHNDSLQDHIKFLSSRIEMMKALNNSSPKDFDGDKNSLEMKCLNSNCESSVNLSCESTSLENSVDKLGLETDSLLNSHESLSSSLPSVCVSEASNSSQDSGTGRIVPTDLQLILKRQGLTVEDLMQSAPPFAVSWKSARNVFQCLTCATPIDFLSRKYHCWNCGEVFCKRCIDKQCSLPGHYSDNRVPVCKQCYKILKKFK
ncbi:phosphatidylinositol-3,5-bisphosphate 3-phosphatase MTMR6-like [Porites lutea]|uniref:phosphatidylinositol-3,5-bisphosphate 3-phosphatase MTMR6-like n=1 Tax=Porites lutea TaxID=51062 RepID=UPI003CC5E2B6